jgi:two-component system, LytTR family, response regulator
MIRVFIVDDERLAVERLARLLGATGRVNVVGTSTDPVAALASVREAAIDALFLDVQMPEVDGFEFLRRLDCNVPVVFTTAFDRYALEAFDVNSVDYLLKPVGADRLARALDRLERSATAAGDRDVRALARELATHLAARRPLERVATRDGERTILLDVARVTHFVARDKAAFAVVNGREHPIDRTIGELELALDERRFVRIHRATIVNVLAIQSLDKAIDGGLVVRLKPEPQAELPVARDRVRELKDRLGI